MSLGVLLPGQACSQSSASTVRSLQGVVCGGGVGVGACGLKTVDRFWSRLLGHRLKRRAGCLIQRQCTIP